MAPDSQDELVNKHTNWTTLFRCGYHLDKILADNRKLLQENAVMAKEVKDLKSVKEIQIA